MRARDAKKLRFSPPVTQALALRGDDMKLLKLSDKEILDIVFPLAEHTENSWNQKNYEGFCLHHLKEKTEHIFPKEEFNRQIEESYDIYGYHEIGDFVALHRNPENIIVLWKVKFEKRKEPGLLIYGFTERDGDVFIEGCSYNA